MERKKRIILFASCLISLAALPAQDLSLITLLQGYLENDSEVQTAGLNLQRTQLNLQRTNIDRGLDISISTGTVTYQMGDNSSFKLNPNVKLSLPTVQKMSVNASTGLTFSSGNDDVLSSASLTLAMDIISENADNQKITDLKNQRSILEAERQLSQKLLSTEKQFYNTIKSLLNSAQSVISAENNLYSDKIKLEQTKTKGYTPTSTTYRQAELKVRSDENTVDTKVRTYFHDLMVFYSKCGYDFEPPEDLTDVDFLSFLPLDFPEFKLIDIETLDKSLYQQIETAVWNKKISDLENAAKKDFTLTGNAGYSYAAGKSVPGGVGGNGGSSSSGTSTVNLGLTGTYKGLSANGGVNFPISSNSSPSITASVTLSPNTFKKKSIDAEISSLSEETEKITMAKAENSYEVSVVDYTESKKNLLWQASTIQTNLEMSQEIEETMKKNYDAGVISLTEYKNAVNSRREYEISLKSNIIDSIIYNNNVKSLFFE